MRIMEGLKMAIKWYEKYIGYCFNDNGNDCILTDITIYEDGRKCYFVEYPKTKTFATMDYKSFKLIAKQTDLPK